MDVITIIGYAAYITLYAMAYGAGNLAIDKLKEAKLIAARINPVLIAASRYMRREIKSKIDIDAGFIDNMEFKDPIMNPIREVLRDEDPNMREISFGINIGNRFQSNNKIALLLILIYLLLVNQSITDSIEFSSNMIIPCVVCNGLLLFKAIAALLQTYMPSEEDLKNDPEYSKPEWKEENEKLNYIRPFAKEYQSISNSSLKFMIGMSIVETIFAIVVFMAYA